MICLRRIVVLSLAWRNKFFLAMELSLGTGRLTGERCLCSLRHVEIVANLYFIYIHLTTGSLQDFTVFGGSLSETHAQKIVKVMQKASEVGVPVCINIKSRCFKRFLNMRFI